MSFMTELQEWQMFYVSKVFKKALFEALNDKGANFDGFASQEKLDVKTDIDFAKIVK